MDIEGITLGQIFTTIGIVAGAITGLGVILKFGGKVATKWLQKGLEPVYNRLDVIERDITKSRMSTCKNFLVRFLADVEQGEQIDETEIERFHENFELYTSLGGNSYIKHKVDKLKKEGKL